MTAVITICVDATCYSSTPAMRFLNIYTYLILTLSCCIAQLVYILHRQGLMFMNRSVIRVTICFHSQAAMCFNSFSVSRYSHFLHSVSASTSLSTRDTSLNRFLWVSRTISGSPPLSVRNRSKSSTMMPVDEVCSADEGRCGGIQRGGAKEQLLMNIHHAAAAKFRILRLDYG